MNDDAGGWERLATNLRVEAELLPALDALGELPVVVFKGGLLTRRLYGDLGARASADNDVLVRARDARAALERLSAAGYRPLGGLDAQRALTRAGQVTLFPDGSALRPALDLHVEPFSRNFFRVDEATIWARLEPAELHGRRVLTFDAPLTLCHQVAHFVQHLLDVEQLPHVGRGWDVLGREVDELRGLAARTCGLAALEYTLGLAEEYGFVRRGPCPVTTWRARVARERFGKSFLDRGPRGSVRGLVAIWVAGPARLPRALARGFLPEGDELRALYGPGLRLRLQWRHWLHRLRD